MLQCLAFTRNKLSSIMVLTLHQTGPTRSTPYDSFVYCAWFPFTSYILYFLQEQSASALTKCEKSKDYGAMIKGR